MGINTLSCTASRVDMAYYTRSYNIGLGSNTCSLMDVHLDFHTGDPISILHPGVFQSTCIFNYPLPGIYGGGYTINISYHF